MFTHMCTYAYWSTRLTFQVSLDCSLPCKWSQGHLLRDSSLCLVCQSSLLQGTLVSASCARITGGGPHSPAFMWDLGIWSLGLLGKCFAHWTCPQTSDKLLPVDPIFCSCTSKTQALCPAEAASPWSKPTHFLVCKWNLFLVCSLP